jgi:transcriptional regulator with XRE-family HTH domain
MSTEIHNKSETFADRLRKARRAKGLGQEDLAAKLEVSSGSVGNWEIGPSLPRPKTLGKIAALLEVTPAWLLYGGGRGGFELQEDHAALKRSPEGSPLGMVQTKTLENMLADLSLRLHKASPMERKHVIGNIIDVANELEAREISSKETGERAVTPESPPPGQIRVAVDHVTEGSSKKLPPK